MKVALVDCLIYQGFIVLRCDTPRDSRDYEA